LYGTAAGQVLGMREQLAYGKLLYLRNVGMQKNEESFQLVSLDQQEVFRKHWCRSQARLENWECDCRPPRRRWRLTALLEPLPARLGSQGAVVSVASVAPNLPGSSVKEESATVGSVQSDLPPVLEDRRVSGKRKPRAAGKAGRQKRQKAERG